MFNLYHIFLCFFVWSGCHASQKVFFKEVSCIFVCMCTWSIVRNWSAKEWKKVNKFRNPCSFQLIFFFKKKTALTIPFARFFFTFCILEKSSRINLLRGMNPCTLKVLPGLPGLFYTEDKQVFVSLAAEKWNRKKKKTTLVGMARMCIRFLKRARMKLNILKPSNMSEIVCIFWKSEMLQQLFWRNSRI